MLYFYVVIIMKNTLCQQLRDEKALSDSDLKALICSNEFDTTLFSLADEVRREIYGTDVYIRGLIEFTNYCKNDCFYCGLRCSNRGISRYRLSQEEILSCCEVGYNLGFRTFVLQGGEDLHFTDGDICRLCQKIKERYPSAAVTLSLGERSKQSYRDFYSSGANRYLLRHETANEEHYAKLHPTSMSLKNRKSCLYNLKEIGYQVGTGFMVGSPYQSCENIIEDLHFISELDPDMVGIGPFITHNGTPFRNFENGSVSLTLRLISIIRLMLPHALIPATTALGTLDASGREKGLCAGANVVMPNLSPVDVRKKYSLYENKICTGEEAAECLSCLKKRVDSVGYKIVTDIGDVKR